MEFSPVTHRRVLGEARDSPGPLEVVGIGGVAGKDAKCPIRTRGMGGGGSHQQRKCGTPIFMFGDWSFTRRAGAGQGQPHDHLAWHL